MGRVSMNSFALGPNVIMGIGVIILLGISLTMCLDPNCVDPEPAAWSGTFGGSIVDNMTVNPRILWNSSVIICCMGSSERFEFRE